MKKIITKHFDFINTLLEKRYKFLLFSLIAMIVIPSLLEQSIYQSLVSFTLNSITIFLSIYAIQESKKQLIIGFILAICVLTINQVGIFKEEATLDFYLSFFIYLIFYAYLAFRLLKMIIATDAVNIGVLYASIIVYLLIGVVGGYLFMLVENATPGSITNLELENITNPNNFFYFSFITLSTVGYGDIIPYSAPAKSICMILSTSCPLYLTVLIALLVSRFDNPDL